MISGLFIISRQRLLTKFANRLKFGECFFRADADTCREYLDNSTKELKAQADQLETQLDETKKKMNKLKSVLYSKFGNNINLEED